MPPIPEVKARTLQHDPGHVHCICRHVGSSEVACNRQERQREAVESRRETRISEHDPGHIYCICRHVGSSEVKCTAQECQREAVKSRIAFASTWDHLRSNAKCRNASVRQSRAGREDTRRPMAIWLGRPMSWQRGKRRAIVEAGRLHPDKVYAGLTEWEGVPLPGDVTECVPPAACLVQRSLYRGSLGGVVSLFYYTIHY